MKSIFLYQTDLITFYQATHYYTSIFCEKNNKILFIESKKFFNKIRVILGNNCIINCKIDLPY